MRSLRNWSLPSAPPGCATWAPCVVSVPFADVELETIISFLRAHRAVVGGARSLTAAGFAAAPIGCRAQTANATTNQTSDATTRPRLVPLSRWLLESRA